MTASATLFQHLLGHHDRSQSPGSPGAGSPGEIRRSRRAAPGDRDRCTPSHSSSLELGNVNSKTMLSSVSVKH
eukprot:1863781-Prymnesium_polylepis.1